MSRKKYLSGIQKLIPEYFDVIENGHTLFIDTKLMSNGWESFASIGVSIKKLNFIKLSININDHEVILDKTVRHFFPFRNKNYLTFGHKFNKEGILTELPKSLWEKIKEDGYFTLYLSFSLLDGETDRLYLEGEAQENGSIPLVTYGDMYIKINVKNIENGNHLLLNKPIAFFKKENYDDFKQCREDYISDQAMYVPKKWDLKNDNLWWAFSQAAEIAIEPYDIYFVHRCEHFSFYNVLDSHTPKVNPHAYKIVGRIKQSTQGVKDERN